MVNDSTIAEMPSDLTQDIVTQCLDIDVTDITLETRNRAEILLRDLLGVLLASRNSTESSLMVCDFVDLYGTGPTTVVGQEKRVPAPVAAFANGTISHGIELDDTHSGASLHPGAVIFPTALAMAEQESTSGDAFLEAVVSGYEMMIRIGRGANPPSMYTKGFHPTACCGAFGAALTAARLISLDCKETENAIGIAGSFAAGNIAYGGTMSKRIQPGVAAQAGVISAELARQGYTGSSEILEDENGFFQGYSADPTPEQMFTNIDDKYEFELDRTGIKPHACCRYNQTPIDAALELAHTHNIDTEDIHSIEVGIVEAAISAVAEPRLEKLRPTTTTDAQFSVYYGISVALVEGEAFLEQHHEPYLNNEDILGIAELVEVKHDSSLEQYYPAYWPARVTIMLSDGTTYETTLQTCRGDPANPLSPGERQEKFRKLAGRELDEEDLNGLEEAVETVFDAPGVNDLTAYLRPRL